MTGFNDSNKSHEQDSNQKLNRFCKICNMLLSIVYLLFGWIFGFLGIMFFSLGLPDEMPCLVFSFLSSLLFLLTPAFCIFGIILSVRFRKKENFTASILVSFLPFGALGVALLSFILSMIY